MENRELFINTISKFTSDCLTDIFISLLKKHDTMFPVSEPLICIAKSLNYCYKCLIIQNKEDQDIIDFFNKMQEYSGNSPLCLLNVIFKVSKIIIEEITGQMGSFKEILSDHPMDKIEAAFFSSMKGYTDERYASMYSDTYKCPCNGPKDLTHLDPNEPLFSYEFKLVPIS